MRVINIKRQFGFAVAALLIALFATLTAEAHGENVPGPNGGRIRMPGPYHTEVVQMKDGFRIYLLDIEFKYPVVQNSYVRAAVQREGQKQLLSCSVQKNYFFCPFTKSEESGNLIVQSKREAVTGNEATYSLPIR